MTLDEQADQGLHGVIGRGKIGQFIERLVRPHVTEAGLEASYQALAADEQSDLEAAEWPQGVGSDVARLLG